MSLFISVSFFIEEYLPVFLLSIIAGFSGIIKRKEVSFTKILEIITSNGLLGVITLVLLKEFFPDFSIETKYAIVILASYIGLDEALEMILKIKGLKR